MALIREKSIQPEDVSLENRHFEKKKNPKMFSIIIEQLEFYKYLWTRRLLTLYLDVYIPISHASTSVRLTKLHVNTHTKNRWDLIYTFRYTHKAIAWFNYHWYILTKRNVRPTKEKKEILPVIFDALLVLSTSIENKEKTFLDDTLKCAHRLTHGNKDEICSHFASFSSDCGFPGNELYTTYNPK